MKSQPMKQEQKFAVASGRPLTDSDMNALRDFVEGMRKKEVEPTFVVHEDQPEIPGLQAFALVHYVKVSIMQRPDPDEVSFMNSPHAPTLERLVAIQVAGAVRLGDGGKVVVECRKAGLPIWPFKTKA